MADLPEGVRELDHTADTGIELEASDVAALFDRAARALRALAVPDSGGADGSPERPRENGHSEAGGEGDVHAIELEADDPAVLLVRWLSELLYRIDTLGLAYETGELEVGDRRLRARIRETRLPAPGAQIKAVTYHGLTCGPRPDGSWAARVIFDV